MNISKYSHLKQGCIDLRKQGQSITSISKDLGVPLSTLSGWLREVKLTPEQQEALKVNSAAGLDKARIQAGVWHNNQKRLRILKAKTEADQVLDRIDTKNVDSQELALALLYFGEGSKQQSTALGGSDPLMLNFFITCLENIYGLDKMDFRYDLHLRNDQNEDQMKDYWSAQLKIDKSMIGYTYKDKRTAGKPTRPGYYGVCLVDASNIAIQRRLLSLYTSYCSQVIAGV